jgi:hypothetical protein
MAEHRATPVDHGEGFAPWLVVIPVISLLMAGLLIVVLSTLVRAPRSPALSLSPRGEEIQVEQSVLDEIEAGETTTRLGPAFLR